MNVKIFLHTVFILSNFLPVVIQPRSKALCSLTSAVFVIYLAGG